MKRLNHTILFATVVMVSISGCSGGKLRNLLSRNSYQTLEEQNAEQLGLPGDNKTQIVSSETQKEKSFFKLPGFLKAEDESSVIAPDPFITASNSNPIESNVAAYRTKVDERIAREAQAAKTTLSDVEKQAQQLYEDSKDNINNPFGAFAKTEAEAASSDDSLSSTKVVQTDSFAEMFGQPEQAAETEVARPLIDNATANPFRTSSTSSTPKSDISEFDKLLHAHEQLSPNPSTALPGDFEDVSLLAETNKPVMEKMAAEPSAEDFFGNINAFDNAASNSDSDVSFASLMEDNKTAESSSDIWGQLDGNQQSPKSSQSDDFFAASFENQQPTSHTDEVFNSDFQQTASLHNFSETTSAWKSLPTHSGPDESTKPLAPLAELRGDNQALMTEPQSETYVQAPSSDADMFFPASQSKPVDSLKTATAGQSMGLIIPTSNSNESNTLFEFGEQPSAVQQISGTQTNTGLTSVATATLTEDADLFAEADAGVAVQNVIATSGWTRRTWFLIIGCVLIAGLLFLPERQKR